MLGKISYSEGGKALQQVPLSSGCSFHGSVQDQVGCSLDQPGLVDGIRTHGKRLELDNL